MTLSSIDMKESRRRIARTFAAALGLLLTGCALSPYHSQDGKTSVLTTNCGREQPTLDNAIKAADAVAARYHAMADNERLTRNMLGGAVIPLSAIAMFQGSTGHGSSAAISALGLAGAGSYVLAQDFTSSPREVVYLSGAKALTCVRRAYAAFEGKANNQDLAGAIDKQRAALTRLSGAIAQAEANQTRGSSGTAALDYARTLETTAKDVLTDALKLQIGINQLGAQFCSAIEQIGADVAIQARKTDPDPAAVLASAKLLSQFQSSITGRVLPTGPASPPPPTGTDKSMPNMHQDVPVDALSQATREAAGTTSSLAATIAASSSPTASITTAGACDVGQATVTFSVTPDISAVSIKITDTYRLTIHSSVAFPTWQLDGGSADAVTAQLVIDGGQTVLVLTAKKATGSNPINVTIRDGSGTASKSIAVTVPDSQPVQAQSDPGTPAKSICAAQPADDAGIVGDVGKVKQLQVKLGMPANLQTGCAGTQTRKQIMIFQAANGLPPDGHLTSDLWQRVTSQP